MREYIKTNFLCYFQIVLYLSVESGVCPAFKIRKNKNMINAFEVNVLVNGNRCKQYNHQGRTYIEAKHGSEYELEIKNNGSSRVLTLASVDGLSVLTGKAASEDDTGYIVPGYSPLKIKGFRYSNSEVAAFKFTTKNKSYANQTGGKSAAQNCGIIGVMIYGEKPKPQSYYAATKSQQLRTKGFPDESTTDWMEIEYSSGQSMETKRGIMLGNYSATNLSLPTFDMGSTWGQKVESKVVELDFEKGNLLYSTDIYYASRDSLIEMGIPLNVSLAVSFPRSFPKKYAEPPTGWRG
jgi:hypothetical protein